MASDNPPPTRTLDSHPRHLPAGSLPVIALIMGLVAPRVIGYFGRAKSQTAQIQMTHIKGALQLMYIDLGHYPREGEGLDPLLTAPAGNTDWQGPYLDDADGLNDPWGRRYL